MKVLVHLNHGTNRSYWLDFGKTVTKKDVADLLKEDREQAVQMLLCLATLRHVPRMEIRPTDKIKFEMAADYTVSQLGYISERLA